MGSNFRILLGLWAFLGAWLSMLQCLSSLLFEGCWRFLYQSEMDVWAGTEKLLWQKVYLQREEEYEIYLRHCGTVEERWFSD